MLSEVVWGALGVAALVVGVAALAWELVAVCGGERRWGIEPLTRIVRDRWMRGRYRWLARVVFIVLWVTVALFWLWLAPHWLVPLDW